MLSKTRTDFAAGFVKQCHRIMRCELLNELAQRYYAATDPCRKRVLLWRYLEHIQSVIWKASPWSSLRAEVRLRFDSIESAGRTLVVLEQGEIPELLTPMTRPGRKAIRRKQFFLGSRGGAD
jgi:hypothetical protein